MRKLLGNERLMGKQIWGQLRTERRPGTRHRLAKAVPRSECAHPPNDPTFASSAANSEPPSNGFPSCRRDPAWLSCCAGFSCVRRLSAREDPPHAYATRVDGP